MLKGLNVWGFDHLLDPNAKTGAVEGYGGLSVLKETACHGSYVSTNVGKLLEELFDGGWRPSRPTSAVDVTRN